MVTVNAPSAPVLSPASRARLRLDPQVAWFAPQPLWTVYPRAELPTRRNVPVILRFEGDDFMNVLLSVLAAQPEALADFVAQAETWRAPSVGLNAPGADENDVMKLYQPAHNRYYMVAAALACKIPGVPDRTINTRRSESAFFVVRRWSLNAATKSYEEQAWLTGAGGGAKGWHTLNGDLSMTLPADEERFPLFPMHYQQDGVTRRILAGMIPVTSNETERGKIAQSVGNLAGGDPRPALFEQQVTVPLYGLALEPNAPPALADAPRRQLEHALSYALLDLMQHLNEHIDALYTDILAGDIDTNYAVYGAAAALAELINETVIGSRLVNAGGFFTTESVMLPELLAELEAARAVLLGENFTAESEVSASAPAIETLFRLANVFNEWLKVDGISVSSASYQFRAGDTTIQRYFDAALTQPYVPPADLEYPDVPKFDPARTDDFYVIRMVYERPDCKLPTISAPTRAFLPAPFFDPDAPVRPIRITMPVDTTPEGLRKYGKGVSMILSNQLRQQMDRVKGLKELMDGDLNDEAQLDIGMICSLSIPIITICALILLMIIVQLLNIIFWWLPLFKICLPIPVIRQK